LLTLTFHVGFPSVRLESPEKEQLFISGGYYASRVSEIMQETYRLTRLEYLHCRSWTKGMSEFQLDANGVKFNMRDVGGDELCREQHWRKAIKDSFCVVFVVSLSDYTRTLKDTAKLRTIRSTLWDYLIDEADPKIILLCNKQDVFREKLKDIPLHKGCKEFATVAPQAEGEKFEAYCERCEEAVLTYFKKIPSSHKNCQTVQKRKKENSDFNIKNVGLRGAFITQATDEALFNEVKTKLNRFFYDFCLTSFNEWNGG
jgi:hypothetical protein